jgi:hypothetical protein
LDRNDDPTAHHSIAPNLAAARFQPISITSEVGAVRTDGWLSGERASVVLDFPRQISPIEDRGFVDLFGTGFRGRILGRVPQLLCRSVQSINRLVGSAARIVPARADLLACFGYGGVATFI